MPLYFSFSSRKSAMTSLFKLLWSFFDISLQHILSSLAVSAFNTLKITFQPSSSPPIFIILSVASLYHFLCEMPLRPLVFQNFTFVLFFKHSVICFKISKCPLWPSLTWIVNPKQLRSIENTMKWYQNFLGHIYWIRPVTHGVSPAKKKNKCDLHRERSFSL